jgi:DNA-binding response OmpR family regulator
MARILVIEDDHGLRELYYSDLREDGHHVVVAEDATKGLQLFEAFAPQLVVMDIRLPTMDGLDAMTRILDRDRRVAVVLNSAYSSYKDNFLSWAADAFLVKSSDTTELRSTVREILERRSAGLAESTPAGHGTVRRDDLHHRGGFRFVGRA